MSVPPITDSAGRIVTFYSYKGGVGRSMALANIAVILARDFGLRVVAIDWDLEAPGLNRYFEIPDAEVGPGIIDYFTRYKQMLAQPPEEVAISAEDLDIRSYVTPVESYPQGGSISFLSV
jgi:MinD-like ATPase involved in chromosome partitioning or flagellar assembly